MRLAILKAILALLASLGIWLPHPVHALLCSPGKSPASATPSNCERITLR